MTIETFITVGAIGAATYGAGYCAWQWFNKGDVHPDPWGPEIDQAIRSPEALPVCHHCFTPQEQETWFCPECGAAIGPYNNYMPFINLFSEGEVFRNGVDKHVGHNFVTVVGYLLASISAYMIFAPVYWYFLFKNLGHKEQTTEIPASR